jgi:hypothetical protein
MNHSPGYPRDIECYLPKGGFAEDGTNNSDNSDNTKRDSGDGEEGDSTAAATTGEDEDSEDSNDSSNGKEDHLVWDRRHSRIVLLRWVNLQRNKKCKTALIPASVDKITANKVLMKALTEMTNAIPV